MICKRCWKYGHTVKRCRPDQEIMCQKCGTAGHDKDSCTSQVSKCMHCQDEHLAGDRTCRRYLHEQEILNVAQHEKVSIQRAKQILSTNSNNSRSTTSRPNSEVFPAVFNCKLDPANKRKITPFLLEKCIEQIIGSKPRTIRTRDESTFVVRVSNKRESYAMSKLTKIMNYDVETSVNSSSDVEKGLIYIYGYDLSNFESFKKSLVSELNLVNVEEATWIKSRNNIALPLILSFQSEIPEFVDIPGERIRTRVYEYKKRPLLCNKCLAYGHSGGVCRGDKRCQNCGSLDHTEACILPKSCFHCQKDHNPGDKQCREFKYEEEILSMQSKMRVARSQAIVIFNRENPNFRLLNYSESVKRKKTADSDQSQSSSQGSSKKVIVQESSSGNPQPSSSRHDLLLDEDLTSQNNPVVCAEAMKEFAAFNPKKTTKRPSLENDNDDIEKYEADLRRASEKLPDKKDGRSGDSKNKIKPTKHKSRNR